MHQKKGQELSITALILIVIGVAVAVVIILGFWKGWDYIFNIFNQGPGDLAKTAIACNTYAGNEITKPSLCEYKEIKSKNWINCKDDRLDYELKAQVSSISCSKNPADFCNDLRTADPATYDDKVMVNGKTCTGGWSTPYADCPDFKAKTPNGIEVPAAWRSAEDCNPNLDANKGFKVSVFNPKSVSPNPGTPKCCAIYSATSPYTPK